VLLGNDDPTQSQTASVSGLEHDGSSLRTHAYGADAPGVTTATTTPRRSGYGFTLPPESIVALTPASG
jgi:hypothetical protein